MPHCSLRLFLAAALLTSSSTALEPRLHSRRRQRVLDIHTMASLSEAETEDEEIRVAFAGNSYIYYNDMPRLLEAVSGQQTQGRRRIVTGSCLRGGASLSSLWEKGNGMQNKFGTENSLRPDGTYDIGAPTVEALLKPPNAAGSTAEGERSGAWDVVVMNDYSQAASRDNDRSQSMAILEQAYAPLLADPAVGCSLIVLYATPAYREHTKGSEELGSWQDFCLKQEQGHALYAETLQASLLHHVEQYQYSTGGGGGGGGGGGQRRQLQRSPRQQRRAAAEDIPDPVVRVANVNRAFARVRTERGDALWRELFVEDHFHPSPMGTYLATCVICAVVFEEWGVPSGEGSDVAPATAEQLFSSARRMMAEGQTGRLPTAEEMKYFWEVATELAGSTPDHIKYWQRTLNPPESEAENN